MRYIIHYIYLNGIIHMLQLMPAPGPVAVNNILKMHHVFNIKNALNLTN